MRRIVIFLLLLCLILGCLAPFGYATSVETTEEATDTETFPEIVSGTQGIDATSALLGTGKLVNNVRTSVVFEANSQTMMYAYNADIQMQPASFVKIMTALIAIELGRLEDLVIVTQNAVASVPSDAVSVKLQTNEVLRLEDLLYCLLVGSANDAAAVIAEHLGGNQEAFVQKMNDYAAQLGCTGTQFANPHGLYDERQLTTARDSARILAAAMDNEVFRRIFTANTYTVPATNMSEARNLQTGNSMKDSGNRQYYDSRILGGRTGVTSDGRRCLASAAEHKGMLLICIVMGSDSVYQEDGYSAISIGGYQETTKLLNACTKGYKASQILYKNQALRQIPINGGNCDVIVGPDVSVSTVLPQNAEISNIVFRYSDKIFSAPVEKGQLVSEVQAWYGNVCVAQTELFALNEVRNASDELQPVVQEQEGDYSAILWITITLFAVVIVLFVLKHFGGVKSLIAKIRRRNYRRSHRRSK